MRRLLSLSVFTLGLCGCAALEPRPAVQMQAAAPAYAADFGPMASMVGKRFKGSPTGGSSETLIDYQSWEWALGGTAILIRHVLSDGRYGGNTYVYRNAATGALDYVYITNSGFRTEGSFTLAPDGSWIAVEDVVGQGDITKVRSTGRILPDGTTESVSEYLKGGEWVPGHAFRYAETDQPMPELKAPARAAAE